MAAVEAPLLRRDVAVLVSAVAQMINEAASALHAIEGDIGELVKEHVAPMEDEGWWASFYGERQPVADEIRDFASLKTADGRSAYELDVEPWGLGRAEAQKVIEASDAVIEVVNLLEILDRVLGAVGCSHAVDQDDDYWADFFDEVRPDPVAA